MLRWSPHLSDTDADGFNHVTLRVKSALRTINWLGTRLRISSILLYAQFFLVKTLDFKNGLRCRWRLEASIAKLMQSCWSRALFILESPWTQHGLVSASVIGVGKHIYDGVGDRRDEEGYVVDDWNYLEAVIEVIHITLSGVLDGPKTRTFS